MKTGFAEGVWGRAGLLASAFVLAVVLIVASWSNYRSARAATTALHLGQARIFEREVMGAIRRNPDRYAPAAMQAAIDSVLAEQSENGLRYVAVPDGEGGILVSAGLPTAPAGGGAEFGSAPSDSGRGFTLTVIDARVRMSFIRSRAAPQSGEHAPGGEPAGEAQPGRPPAPVASDPPPAGRGGDRGARPRYTGIILEFEPMIATRLVDRAGQLLVFGLVAALGMLLVASVSWVMSRRYERAKLNLEQERRLSLLGQMSAVLAHEIRNPLASLKGHAQLLAERLETESPDRRKADRVILEAGRLEALTGDLLDFVRSGPIDRSPVDPAELARASVEEVAPDGFALDLARAPERWPMDGPRMRQVFTNLLRNALQASPAGGPRPALAIGVEGDHLVIALRDHGGGLPAGQEDRIFEPFFTTRVTGTGLGLAVARRIVELHGGTLTAGNHPAGGAVFRAVLPAGKE